MATLQLEQQHLRDDAGGDALDIEIVNAGARALSVRTLHCMTQSVPADAPAEFVLPAGGRWRLRLGPLQHAPANRSQGIMSAYIVDAAGQPHEAVIAGLRPASGVAAGPLKTHPPGHVTTPLALLPQPASLQITDYGGVPLFVLKDGGEDIRAVFRQVAQLHRRLFPDAPEIFGLSPIGAFTALSVRHDGALDEAVHRLTFTEAGANLLFGDRTGLFYGLVSLAQMAHGARSDARFSVPLSGEIADRPAFAWRGCHMDVARNFRPMADISRFLDILAWMKFNRFHFHLTDDEGWRMESVIFPRLHEIGGFRGHGHALPAQYADGAATRGGFYSREEIRLLIDHAAALHISIMPEIDLPGHCAALLAAYPDYTDPGETPDSYRSIQNFPNNAINPGVEKIYPFLDALLGETAALFPFSHIHMGGDEVDARSWAQSPAAGKLAKREKLQGATGLQSYFMRRMHGLLRDHGKAFAGWDECAEGGGIPVDGSLLFAWRSAAHTTALLEKGHDVIFTPGAAFYLDMHQAGGWDEPGASWAGISTPEACYAQDPARDVPPGAPGRLLGIQAGLWSEHIISCQRFNHMVFPRLGAIAEIGWSPPETRDWLHFCALSRLMPQL